MAFDLNTIKSVFRPIGKANAGIQNITDDFFNTFKHDFPYSLITRAEQEVYPRLDISETNSYYCLEFDLPGMDKKHLELKMDNNMLTVKGTKEQEKERKDSNFYTRERYYGEFQRSLNLPSGIDTDKIDANFKDGVLTVKIPKTNISASRAIKIEG